MRRSSKFIAVAGIVAVTASAALAGTASAAAPTGSPVLNEAQGTTAGWAEKQAAIAAGDNIVAWGSSALIQNGQFVSGQYLNDGTPDWQHQKGNRAAAIQAELALTGLGSLADH